MEIKRNEATRNRPEGDRAIDAPYIFADFDEFMRLLKDEDAWRKYDRNGITLFKTDNLTSVLTCIKKGGVIKDNTVNGILQFQVIEGEIRVTTTDGDITMKKNQMINFHPNITHSIEAVKDSAFLIQTIQVNA